MEHATNAVVATLGSMHQPLLFLAAFSHVVPGPARTYGPVLLRPRPHEHGEFLDLTVFVDIHHVHGQSRVIFVTGLQEANQLEGHPMVLLRPRPHEHGEFLDLTVFVDIHHVHGQSRVIFVTGLQEANQLEGHPMAVRHAPAHGKPDPPAKIPS